MRFLSFRHPDISLPVAGRRMGEEVLEALFHLGGVAASGGRPGSWERPCYPNRRAYHAAVKRLQRKGLVAGRRRGDQEGVLQLTAEGEARLAEEHRPQRWWGERWRGTWYVLVYDVPEAKRGYRDHLRGFLARMRMGCLQRSVWVTPRDIRPAYRDLDEAAGVSEFARLLEARTVLGEGAAGIVGRAWDFGRLGRVHHRFLEVYGENLRRLAEGRPTADALGAVVREELAAYREAMALDPLLPRALHPPGYRGEEVHALHRRFLRAAARRL